MNRSYVGAVELVRHAVGPLEPHLGAFVASLIAEGYSVNCVYIKARHTLAFDRWLKTGGLSIVDVDENQIGKYQRSKARRRSRRLETRRMERRAITKRRKAPSDFSPASQPSIGGQGICTFPMCRVAAKHSLGKYQVRCLMPTKMPAPPGMPPAPAVPWMMNPNVPRSRSGVSGRNVNNTRRHHDARWRYGLGGGNYAACQRSRKT